MNPTQKRSALPDDARALMAGFEPSNAKFAQAYGILFREPLIEDRVRPNVASSHHLDDDEQAAVRAFAHRTVGVDPAPWLRRPRSRRASRPAPDTRRTRRPRLGSIRWYLRSLLHPCLPWWRMVLKRSLKRRFVVP